MQEMLLDRRTQSLVNDYVPEGEILDELVCFFTIFADYTRLRMISAASTGTALTPEVDRQKKMSCLVAGQFFRTSWARPGCFSRRLLSAAP